MPDFQDSKPHHYLRAVTYSTNFYDCTATSDTPIKTMLSALLSTDCELSIDDLKGAAELLNKKLAELQNSKELHILFRIRKDKTLAVMFDAVCAELEIIEKRKRAKELWPEYDWRIGKITEL